jgi:hypothetical protein
MGKFKQPLPTASVLPSWPRKVATWWDLEVRGNGSTAHAQQCKHGHVARFEQCPVRAAALCEHACMPACLHDVQEHFQGSSVLPGTRGLCESSACFCTLQGCNAEDTRRSRLIHCTRRAPLHAVLQGTEKQEKRPQLLVRRIRHTRLDPCLHNDEQGGNNGRGQGGGETLWKESGESDGLVERQVEAVARDARLQPSLDGMLRRGSDGRAVRGCRCMIVCSQIRAEGGWRSLHA